MNQLTVEDKKCSKYSKEVECENSSNEGSPNKCLQAYLFFLCAAAAVVVFVVIQLNVSKIKNEFWISGKNAGISLSDPYNINYYKSSEDSFLSNRKPIKLKKRANSVPPVFKRRTVENIQPPLWFKDSDFAKDKQPPKELLLQ